MTALYPGATLSEDAAHGLGDVLAGGDGYFDGGEVLVDWIGGSESGRRHTDLEIRVGYASGASGARDGARDDLLGVEFCVLRRVQLFAARQH